MALPEPSAKGPRVVVLGGGNGTSRLLHALLPFLHHGKIASLHALVQMADDGGSTGRIRQQYDVGAMGDLSRCLLALSKLQGDIRGEKFLRALDYRFADGDFKGHTLRNALMAALEITSDLDAAIATFARILQVPKYAGVIPTTLQLITQRVLVEENGVQRILGEGQHFISWNVDLQEDMAWLPGDVRVTFAEKDVPLNPRAREALEQATHIIVAPGHTYGTILPTLASLRQDPGFSLRDSKAELIAVMTLLTTPAQTIGWTGEDFVGVYASYINKPFDLVVANTGRADIELVPGQEWVGFHGKRHPYRLLRADVVSTEEQKPNAGDAVPRAVVIHDAEKMRQIFASEVFRA